MYVYIYVCIQEKNRGGRKRGILFPLKKIVLLQCTLPPYIYFLGTFPLEQQLQNKKEEEEIIVFQTRGWVTGTHSHKIKDNKINKDIVVLCDVCPVCGHITEEEVYRGDGNPILLGVYSHVEETHGSKFHGAMPYGIKVEDREILDYIENTYFREDQDE